MCTHGAHMCKHGAQMCKHGAHMCKHGVHMSKDGAPEGQEQRCTGCRRSRRTSWSNSASKQARDLIFFLNPGFWLWGIIYDHFQRPQMGLKGKNSLYRL